MDTVSPSTFHLGINMPGAVSAGAYTAGVLDFLIEALEAWQDAKTRGELVPAHTVSIDVLSGTSAGGVVASLAALDLRYGRLSMQSGVASEPASQTISRVRRAWVDLLDIRPMLQNGDLANITDLAKLTSVLNSNALLEIGRNLATPQPDLRPCPAFVSPSLSLFLTLSNIRGTPYTIAEANLGSPEQRIRYYADQVQFQFLSAGAVADRGVVPVRLDSNDAEDPDWQTFRTAATATGAFPVAFAPQTLQRPLTWYTDHLWTVPFGEPEVASPAPPLASPFVPPVINQALAKQTIAPELPKSLGGIIGTLNVDGGVTNNDPFECARGYLATKLLDTDLRHFPRTAQDACEAVISIAPFPGDDPIDPDWDPDEHKGIPDVLSRVLGALIAQSRFTGESLSLLKEGKTFSRFVIAPDGGETRPGRPDKDGKCDQLPALQSGTLGAFAGFLSKEFREHDYALGRRNCQRFLTRHFVLPESNKVLRASLQGNSQREEILNRHKIESDHRPQADIAGPGERWLPIIPLCTQALRDEVKLNERSLLSDSDLSAIGTMIGDRLKLLLKVALQRVPFLLRGPLVIFTSNYLRDKAMAYISAELKQDGSA